MEHRNGRRRHITLTVSLRQGERFLGQFTTQDFNKGGVALNGTVRELRNNSVVRVAFESQKYGPAFETACKALVIHQDDGRIGLMWMDHEGAGLDERLVELMSVTDSTEMPNRPDLSTAPERIRRWPE